MPASDSRIAESAAGSDINSDPPVAQSWDDDSASDDSEDAWSLTGRGSSW